MKIILPPSTFKNTITRKNPNNIEKLHQNFSESKEEIHKGIFCQNVGITAYTLGNYSNFESKFLFNNGSFFEINYYYNRSWGNISFADLSEIINTLSNPDFAGLDKFRLQTNLGIIKEMCVKMNKIKVTEMKVVWVTLLIHLFLL